MRAVRIGSDCIPRWRQRLICAGFAAIAALSPLHVWAQDSSSASPDSLATSPATLSARQSKDENRVSSFEEAPVLAPVSARQSGPGFDQPPSGAIPDIRPASPAPNGARGFLQEPGEGSQAGLLVPRVLFFPARVALQAATLPVRFAGSLLSPTGFPQDWTRAVDCERPYFVPLLGVDPTIGATAAVRLGHDNPYDPNGCVTYRLSYGGIGEQIYSLTLRSRDPYLPPYQDGWSYRLLARYEVMSDRHYFGRGNVSRHKDRTLYTQERYLALASLCYAPSDWMRWDFSLSAHRRQIRPARDLDDGERSIEQLFPNEHLAPGLILDPQNIQGEIALTLDGRDERARPTRGAKSELFFAYAHGTGPDIVDFVWYGGELQYYHTIAPRHVLATRISAEEARTGTQTATGTYLPVKFTELPSLGGPTTLRGYERDRFMDNGATLATIEYRYQVSPLVEATVFADFGKVLPRLLDFDFQAIHRSWGAGLRIATNEWMLIRLQAAASDEDTIVYASLDSAFDRPDRRERR